MIHRDRLSLHHHNTGNVVQNISEQFKQQLTAPVSNRDIQPETQVIKFMDSPHKWHRQDFTSC